MNNKTLLKKLDNISKKLKEIRKNRNKKFNKDFLLHNNTTRRVK